MDDQPDRVLAAPVQRRLRDLALACTLATLTGCFGAYAFLAEYQTTWDRHLVDWLTYANAVDRWLTGAPIYAPEQLAGPYKLTTAVLIGYAYPPPSLLLFLPFALIPFGGAVWICANVALLVSGMLAITRRQLGSISPLAMVATLFVIAGFRPFAQGVIVGNANIGLAGLMAWAWALGRDGAWIGPAAGLVAFIKVTQASLVAWSARSARATVAVALVMIAVAVITLPLFTVDTWSHFATALSNAVPNCAPFGIYPYSVACVAGHYVSPSIAKLIGLAIGVGLTALALVARPRLIVFALVILAAIAPVSDLHLHTAVYLLVLAWVAILVWYGRARGTWIQRGHGGNEHRDRPHTVRRKRSTTALITGETLADFGPRK